MQINIGIKINKKSLKVTILKQLKKKKQNKLRGLLKNLNKTNLKKNLSMIIIICFNKNRQKMNIFSMVWYPKKWFLIKIT